MANYEFIPRVGPVLQRKDSSPSTSADIDSDELSLPHYSSPSTTDTVVMALHELGGGSEEIQEAIVIPGPFEVFRLNITRLEERWNKGCEVIVEKQKQLEEKTSELKTLREQFAHEERRLKEQVATQCELFAHIERQYLLQLGEQREQLHQEKGRFKEQLAAQLDRSTQEKHQFQMQLEAQLEQSTQAKHQFQAQLETQQKQFAEQVQQLNEQLVTRQQRIDQLAQAAAVVQQQQPTVQPPDESSSGETEDLGITWYDDAVHPRRLRSHTSQFEVEVGRQTRYTGLYVCEYCGRDYNSLLWLNKHLKGQHPDEAEEEEEEEEADEMVAIEPPAKRRRIAQEEDVSAEADDVSLLQCAWRTEIEAKYATDADMLAELLDFSPCSTRAPTLRTSAIGQQANVCDQHVCVGRMDVGVTPQCNLFASTAKSRVFHRSRQCVSCKRLTVLSSSAQKRKRDDTKLF